VPYSAFYVLQADNVSNTTIVNICIPLELKDQLNDCNSALDLIDSGESQIHFQCIAGGSVKACLKMVQDGVAQLAKVPASGTVLGQEYGLKPVISEYFSDELGNSTEGYAVALVDANWCYNDNGGKPSAEDLRGSKACFSGLSTDGGWFTPIGFLMKYGNMSLTSEDEDVSDDAESVLSYFSEVCAPGVYPMNPKMSGKSLKKLCNLCEDQNSCQSSNPWHGVEGSLQCGYSAGDVTFTSYPMIDASVGAGNLVEAPPPPPPAPQYPPPVAVEEAAAPVPAEAESKPAVPAQSQTGDKKKNDNNNKNKDKNGNKKNEKPRRILMQVGTDALFASKLLFCPQKSPACQPLSAYQDCNLGKLPSQTFLVSEKFLKSELGNLAVDKLVSSGASAIFMNQAAKVGEDPYWLITPGAMGLRLVDSYESYSDQDFVDYTRRSIDSAYNMGADGGTDSSSSGGLSTGAIIGIAVGASVLLGVIVVVLIAWSSKRKEKSGWKQYKDAVSRLHQ
jgi:hypothetical protein